jgi:hypothetical protein
MCRCGARTCSRARVELGSGFRSVDHLFITAGVNSARVRSGRRRSHQRDYPTHRRFRNKGRIKSPEQVSSASGIRATGGREVLGAMGRAAMVSPIPIEAIDNAKNSAGCRDAGGTFRCRRTKTPAELEATRVPTHSDAWRTVLTGPPTSTNCLHRVRAVEAGCAMPTWRHEVTF